MKDLNFLLNCSVSPQLCQVMSLYIHEGSYFAMRLLLQYHVLDDILLEMWMLEDLMLGLCEKEHK